MAFNELLKLRGQTHRIEGVRLGTSQGNARFNIGAAVMERFAPDAKRIKVLVGSGEDYGRVRLVPTENNDGYAVFAGGRKAAARMVVVSARRLGLAGPVKSTDLPYEITDAGLIVDIRPVMVKPAVAA